MVVAWFLVRTVADVDSRAYLLWLLAAGALALVAPKSGLVVLIATSVFFEPDSLARTLAPRELIVLPLAVGVLIQVAVDRFRWRPGLSDLARSPARRRYGAWRRAYLPGLRPGLPMARRPIVDRQHARADHHPRRCRVDGAGGDLRVLVVAIGVAVVAAVVRLVEYAAPGSISNGPFAWVGFWKGFGARLAGTIPSPNALSTQLIVPTMVLLAAVDAGARRPRCAPSRRRASCRCSSRSTSRSVGRRSSPCTSSSSSSRGGSDGGRESPCWSLGSSAGAAGAAGVSPARRQARSRRRGDPGSILVASDEYRFKAWGAALRMVEDKPLIGQGYLAYKELAETYSATRSWVRHTTNGSGSSPRRASSLALLQWRFSWHRHHAGARPGLARDRDPCRVPRLCHRGVVQQPVAVRARVGRGLRHHRCRPRLGGACPRPDGRGRSGGRTAEPSSRPTTRR